MKSGKVDSLMTWEPITSRAVDEGTAYGLVRSWVPEDRKQYIGSDHDLASVMVTRDDVIKDRPQDLQAFTNGFKAAIAYAKNVSSLDLANEIMNAPDIKDQFEGVDPKFLASSIDRVKPSNNVCMSRAGFDVQMNFMVKYGLLQEAIPYETLVDNQFVGVCG
jgi:ABC-type nitrate/sulfonate/bicarbonate transport system substrate-binding protein